MGNRKQAIEEISSFLESRNRILLLTGTYQEQKHVLALSLILTNFPAYSRILFRTNSTRDLDNVLAPVFNGPIHLQRGVPISVGRSELYTDTIAPRTWRSSPNDIDLGIIYPLDSLDYESGGECVQDLIRRNARKIFLISWTDNKDFEWTNQFNPVTVVFDAEEENPDYHRRVVEYLQQYSIKEQIREHLPEYANTTPQEYLIKILCRGQCGTTRWARLNRPYPGRTAIRGAEMGVYRATCLKCGYLASDNYNWYR